MKRMKHKLLLVLLAAVMTMSMAGCKKSAEESKAESNLSVTTSGQAAETETEKQTDQSEQADQKEDQTGIEDQAGTEQNAEGSERILEEDGELVIEVPDGEDTYGE